MRPATGFLRLLAGCWLCALVALSGCASGGVPLEEVSDVPIALVYWDSSAARQRVELMEELSGRGVGNAPRMGMANVDDVAQFVGGRDGSSAAEKLARFPGRIMLLNPRTLEKTRFLAAPPNARPLAWSKDHKRLLFNSDHLDGGLSQIYEYDLETRELRKLTGGPAHHLEGDYGPEGEVMVTWIEPDGPKPNAGMDIRSASGGDSKVVMKGEYPEGPRWSPGENLILYGQADVRGGTRDQSLIVVRGSEPGAAVDPLVRGRDAIFSPDGEWIVFSSQGPRGWRLQRMRPDGSARKALGGSTLSARWPAVSPDGKHVAYISNQDGLDRLYVRRMDGSGDRILLEEGAVAFPVW